MGWCLACPAPRCPPSAVADAKRRSAPLTVPQDVRRQQRRAAACNSSVRSQDTVLDFAVQPFLRLVCPARVAAVRASRTAGGGWRRASCAWISSIPLRPSKYIASGCIWGCQQRNRFGRLTSHIPQGAGLQARAGSAHRAARCHDMLIARFAAAWLLLNAILAIGARSLPPEQAPRVSSPMRGRGIVVLN